MEKRTICFISFCLLIVSYVYSFSSIETINSGWKFIRGNIEKAENIGFNDLQWETVNIPHTWNDVDTEDEKYGYYRGCGWYRKVVNFSINKERKYFIQFEAANQVTELWINGVAVGKKHIGGYTPFTYDITNFIKDGKNLIAVRVDNTHNENIPPLSADFTFFGGIYRDVLIIQKGLSHFDLNYGNGIFINIDRIDRDEAVVHIKSNVVLDDEKKYSIVHYIVDANGKTVCTKKLKLDRKEQNIELIVKRPILWDVNNPYLYKVISTIEDESGKLVDEAINPLGIRNFHFDANKGFYLNGRRLKLIGVNRHQDYKGKGNALSDNMHRSDLELMKELGINCMRISHYPQDKAVLEMCDRLGFICFEEIPIINRINTTKEFENNCKSQIKEMIYRDYNHPCIVAWNSSNEITVPHPNKNKWNDEQNEYYKKSLRNLLMELEEYISKLDPYRKSMIVHCYTPNENHELGYHQGDIIGYNKYFGWYEGDFNDLYTFFDDFHKVEPNKPFFVTEFGAGADVRIHSFNPTIFDHSEEYQIKFLKEHLKAITSTGFVVGGTWWNLVDFNSEFRNDVIPHINEKGLLTSDRRKKASYYYLKAFLCNKPFVSIPTKEWENRGGIEDCFDAGYCTQKVQVFANVDEVELLHNGKSLGVSKVNNNIAEFDVKFIEGENFLELKSTDKDFFVKDFMKIDFDLFPFDFKKLDKQLSVNCGSYCFVNDDMENDNLWLPDQEYKQGQFGYIGGKYYKNNIGIIGTTLNIFNTNLNPIYQTQLVGLNEYRFDVPNGQYEITLNFAELIDDYKRIFNVSINGKNVIKELNLSEMFGVRCAVSERFNVDVRDDDGIIVSFEAIEGETILNGICVRKIY